MLLGDVTAEKRLDTPEYLQKWDPTHSTLTISKLDHFKIYGHFCDIYEMEYFFLCDVINGMGFQFTVFCPSQECPTFL